MAHDLDMDVGARLREVRQRRGLSVEDLAQRTKIRAGLIRALEANRREDLPAAIFVRGFLRAYAREVGLDPEETLREYFAQFEPLEPAEPSEPTIVAASPPPSPAAHAPRLIVRGLTTAEQWLVIAVLVSVGGVALGWWRASGASARPARRPAAASPADGPADRSGTATAGSEPASATATEGRVVQLELHATGPCWVSATIDGARTLYETMQPGERRAFDVSEDAVLRVGNPDALSVSIAGSPARPLGPPGRPVTVRITKDNYRDFLQR